MIVSIAQDPNAKSLDQVAQDLIQNLQQSNPGMQASGSPSSIKVNGVEGRSVNLSSTSPLQKNGQPVTERDWLVTVPRPQGGILYAVFIAPESDFGQLQSTYKKMLNSLHLK